MIKKTLGCVAAFGCLAISASLEAHHSTAGVYDPGKEVTVKGALTKLQFVNPHGSITVAVKNADGTTTDWTFTTGSATALASQGIASHVVEKSPQFGEIGAGLQIAPNASRILHRLGVLDAVRNTAVFPKRLVMKDAVSGETVTSVDLGSRFIARYAQPYFVSHRGDLLAALLACCRRSRHITLEPSKDVTHLESEEHSVFATFADGSTYQCEALIGADGLHSLARSYVAAGQPERARALLVELEARDRAGYVHPSSLAIVYYELGDDARALDLLERAVAEHDARIFHLGTDPYWARLRGKPRFQALARRTGLPGGMAQPGR